MLGLGVCAGVYKSAHRLISLAHTNIVYFTYSSNLTTREYRVKWNNVQRTVSFLLVLMLLSACTSRNVRLEDGNSLLVNKFGVLCNPRGPIAIDGRKVTCRSEDGNNPYVATDELAALVKADLLEAEGFAEQNNDDKVKILIYIHGGLNKVTESIASNEPLKTQITTDDKHWYFPRFLVWPSDGVTNYAEHAFNISGGRYTENVIRGVLGGSATLLSDSLQGIVNVPRSWFLQSVNAKDVAWGLSDNRYQDSIYSIPSVFRVSHAWVQARDNYCRYVDKFSDRSDCREDGYIERSRSTTQATVLTDRKRAKVYWSSFERDSLNPRFIWNRVSAISRLTLGSLTHSEIGSASWRNMKRRAANIASPTVLFDSRIRDRHSCSREGKTCASAMQYFEELLSQINEDDNPERYELTLIGHSMGAFILNSLINSNIDKLVENQLVKNVVYMAAAASIQDTVQTIRNLYQGFDSQGVEFAQWPEVSNLMLNRVAEVSELMFFGLVPGGSLLVWVDEVYERPTHPVERTMGAEVNVYAALPYIERQLGPYYTDKITFKAFDREPGSTPAQHGQFNDGEFWHPAFWQLR